MLTRSTVGDAGDAVTLDGGTATFDTKDIGTGKTVTLSGATLAGADAGNYVLDAVATTTADITALHITGAFTAQGRIYDGGVDATVLTRSTVGDAGDAVTLDGGTATFDTKDIGTGKTVTLSGATLAGADAGNYVLDAVATTTADITALHITGRFTAQGRIYDGGVDATVLTRSTVGDAGDAVTLDGGTATFDTKDIGTGKTVTLSGATLAGADAGNYVLDAVATTTADITALHITGAFTAQGRIYDGGVDATVLTRSTVGDAGDAVTLDGGTATFDTKDIGTGKTVTLSGATLAGADAGNYVLDAVATTTADITALQSRALHGPGQDLRRRRGRDGADAVDGGRRGRRRDAGRRDGDVRHQGHRDGQDGDAERGDPRGGRRGQLRAGRGGHDDGRHHGPALTGASRPRAGSTTAAWRDGADAVDGGRRGRRRDAGRRDGDVRHQGHRDGQDGDAERGDPRGGRRGQLRAGRGGHDDGRHHGPAHHGPFTAQGRIYDGGVDATVLTRSTVGDAGDAVTLDGGTATFDTKDIGTGKTVTLSGATLAGADAGNYVLDAVATTTADITALHITGSFTAQGRIYDGGVDATVLTRSTVGDRATP